MRCRCMRPIGFYPTNPSFTNHPVPLISVDAKIAVKGPISIITLSQTFKNIEENPLEIEYTFPVEDESVVTDMRIIYPDGSIVNGQVKEKEIAYENYNDEIASGNTAYLADFCDGNNVVLSCGNLGSKEMIRVEFRYVSPVKNDMDY